jgi:hypothetical protein
MAFRHQGMHDAAHESLKEALKARSRDMSIGTSPFPSEPKPIWLRTRRRGPQRPRTRLGRRLGCRGSRRASCGAKRCLAPLALAPATDPRRPLTARRTTSKGVLLFRLSPSDAPVPGHGSRVRVRRGRSDRSGGRSSSGWRHVAGEVEDRGAGTERDGRAGCRRSLDETRRRGRYRLGECGESPVFASGSVDEPR